MQDDRFEWQRYPVAQAFLDGHLDALTQSLPPAASLDKELLLRTGTRLKNWLDHLILLDEDRTRGRLRELGFEPEEVPSDPGTAAYFHPGALLPRVLLRSGSSNEAPSVGAAIGVEHIEEFLMAVGAAAPIEGTPFSPLRRAPVWQAGRFGLAVVERRGHSGFLPLDMPAGYADRYLHAYEAWATRRRVHEDDHTAMQHTLRLAEALVAELGTDTAAWIAFSAERANWQKRNRAGQAQKARQDGLGLGWANHDHHTFRSSRAMFPLLIRILQTFGFRKRERFYAGAEAGWGAQVLEQPVCRLAVFADVDLSPDEVASDFATDPLPSRASMGTVGLWCGLHGEAMLGAGLHHVAAHCDSEAAVAGLLGWGIRTMHPFSEFSYLRQAFTQGDRRPVEPARLERLLSSGMITEEQRMQFAERGAVSSHLELIQRGEGFKGFNQHRISDIIRRTDPRLQAGAA